MSTRAEVADTAPPGARAALGWTYVLTIGRYAVTGATTVGLAAILAPREFGVMALALLWVTFAQQLAQHGPAQAVIQREKITDEHLNAAFWTSLGGSLLFAAVFAAGAQTWASINNTPELAAVCWAMAPAIVLNSLIVVPEATLRRDLRFKSLSVRVLAAGLISGVAALAFAVAGFGVWALVAQQLIIAAVSVVAIWAVTPWRPRRASIRAGLADLRHYSLHSSSEFLAYFVTSRADALLLGAFFGPVAIGLFRVVVRITEMATEVSVGGLGQFSLPHLSRLSLNPTDFAAWLTKITHAGAVLALPVFGVLAAAGPHVLGLFGPEWADAEPALRVLCANGVVGVFGTILGPAIQAAGRPKLGAAIGWTQAALTVVTIGAVGVVWSSAPLSTQVFFIAVAFLAVHAVGVVASTVVMFRTVLRMPAWPTVRTWLPAMAAGLAALVVGIETEAATASVHPIWGLAGTAAVASASAAVVLLALDRDVSDRARRVVGRVIRRRVTL